MKRIAGKVEVVLEQPPGQIFRRRTDLHEVGAVPRPAQRHRRLTKERVDVDREVRLPRTAVTVVLDEPHDRRVPLGERPIAAAVGGSHGRDPERDRTGADNERRLHAIGLDTSRSSPSGTLTCSRISSTRINCTIVMWRTRGLRRRSASRRWQRRAQP